MPLFRRQRRPGTDQHPVTSFWTWWADAGAQIDPHRVTSLTDKLTRHVVAIHPELTWHFGPGEIAQHRLTVTAGGVAEVRPWAERWLRAAPAAHHTWEYRSSQQPDPKALTNQLEIAGHKLDLSLTEFRVDPVEEELRVHVGVFHPAFVELPGPARDQVAFLVLDWLLGEDDVERWLGHVEALTTRPLAALPASAVTAAVAGAAELQDTDAWDVLRWEDREGNPGLVTRRRGLRWIDHPTLDRHHAVASEFAAGAHGLPADEACLDRLAAVEVEIDELLSGRGLVVAHETHRGRRTFHVYTDGEDQNVDAALAAWAGPRGIALDPHTDPGWSQVKHLLG